MNYNLLQRNIEYLKYLPKIFSQSTTMLEMIFYSNWNFSTYVRELWYLSLRDVCALTKAALWPWFIRPKFYCIMMFCKYSGVRLLASRVLHEKTC